MPINDRSLGQTPKPLDLAMGQSIRERRRSLGLSQSTLADAIGLTFQQVQKYERGYNRVSFSKLVEIAHALDCRVVDLIGDLDADGVSSPVFGQDTAHLRVSGAPELLAAYVAASPALRRCVLKLVVAIALDQPSGRSARATVPLRFRARPNPHPPSG